MLLKLCVGIVGYTLGLRSVPFILAMSSSKVSADENWMVVSIDICWFEFSIISWKGMLLICLLKVTPRKHTVVACLKIKTICWSLARSPHSRLGPRLANCSEIGIK